jgi:hypothetical protein
MRLVDRQKSRLRWSLAAAFIAFSLFWLRGRAYLDWRHPHEDAFILFRYAEHFAHGYGIVFNEAGPRAEGATDFLYMIVLGLAVRVGVDVAIAALWLNALGAGLIAALLALVATPRTPRPLERAWPLVLATLVPFLGGALASYDGFGTELYCGLVALAFYFCLRASERALVALPYVALTLGLFRPDGVIIGASAVAVLAYFARRDRTALRRLWLHGAIAGALGLAYFVWRWHYFGLLLPLPLYVKSRGGAWDRGWPFLESWLPTAAGPLPLLAAAAVAAALLRRRGDSGFVRALSATLPIWLLLWALTSAHQSQNVDWRFEAPIFTVLVLLVARLGMRVRARYRTLGVCTLVYAGTLAALVPTIRRGKQLWPLDYMDPFAVETAPLLSDLTIATTESGRMSYWNHAVVQDLVGLNSPFIAEHPVTTTYLNELKPDLVMFHAAYTLDLSATAHVGDLEHDRVIRVEAASLLPAVREQFREYAERDLPRYRADDLPVTVAAVVASHYLALHARDFDVFFVRYGDDFNHVFGVEQGQPYTQALEAAILNSNRRYISYTSAKRLGSCAFCGAVRALGLGKVLLWDAWRTAKR